jgi:hypothetical protein
VFIGRNSVGTLFSFVGQTQALVSHLEFGCIRCGGPKNLLRSPSTPARTHESRSQSVDDILAVLHDTPMLTNLPPCCSLIHRSILHSIMSTEDIHSENLAAAEAEGFMSDDTDKVNGYSGRYVCDSNWCAVRLRITTLTPL